MKKEDALSKLSEIFEDANNDWSFLKRSVLGIIENHDGNNKAIETEISEKDHESYLSLYMEGISYLKAILEEVGFEVESVSVGNSMNNPGAKGVFVKVTLKS